ncbi:protein phosphatase 2C domain-containing protein [Kitasatospora azatica]|uniref:protein phosphatase 2C domain-containing protein n=1 Tax=Kitasatospora azatica TaxID=58347 RepID=UPI0009FE8EDB|nr:protein phosphatase 2C domain-containing protein [Kitasatospora azatica]
MAPQHGSDDPDGPARPAPKPHWRLLTCGVRGPRKARYQDWVDGGVGRSFGVLVAVADGHGSAAHTRSHQGAKFAVEVFLELAAEFARLALDGGSALAQLRTQAQQRMPWNIVRAWEQRCAQDLREDPLEGRPAPAAGEKPSRRDLVPYGSTLLGAVITPGLVVAWQLGDGELTLVNLDGTGPLLPLAPEQPELGDETDSLCSRDAAQLIRVHWSPIAGAAQPPGLLMLSTDGLSKSFADQSGFEEFATGLYQRLEQGGPGPVRAQLGQWLSQAATYSGDDTTLVAAWYDRRAGLPVEEPDDSVYRQDLPSSSEDPS